MSVLQTSALPPSSIVLWHLFISWAAGCSAGWWDRPQPQAQHRPGPCRCEWQQHALQLFLQKSLSCSCSTGDLSSLAPADPKKQRPLHPFRLWKLLSRLVLVAGVLPELRTRWAAGAIGILHIWWQLFLLYVRLC